MKTKECPSCAMEVDADSKFCPICNYQFTTRPSHIRWAAIILVVIFLLYLILSL
ncbi:MAG TPA: hypothetical protein VFZ52_05195 [Chryseolinea sp.]